MPRFGNTAHALPNRIALSYFHTVQRRPAFLPLDRFPELLEVQSSWMDLQREAVVTLDTIGNELGDAIGASWILPLIPEDEDRHKFADHVYARACSLAPLAASLRSRIPYILAIAFSKLAAGQHIAEHRHWNPYFTAVLCLQGGAHSHIIVGGERRDFCDGEMFVFDYRMTHEVQNNGEVDRIVLLLLIDPRQ